MCKPSTGEPLVYTTKNVSFTSDLYSITLKPANIEYVILHTFFLFVITGDAQGIFYLSSMHITEEKGWQEVQKANTNQDEASSHLGGHVLEEFNLPLDQL